MDLDAMHKKVQALEGFKARVEKAIAFVEGLQAAGFKMPEAGATLPEDDHQKIVDEVVQLLGPKVQDLVGRIEKIEQTPQGAGATVDLSSIESRLTKLEGLDKLVPTAEDQELSGRLEAMLTWFEANKEGLELLLSLDGEPDAPEDAGTAAGDAAAAGGASDGAAGTSAGVDATANTDPANPGNTNPGT